MTWSSGAGVADVSALAACTKLLFLDSFFEKLHEMNGRKHGNSAPSTIVNVIGVRDGAAVGVFIVVIASIVVVGSHPLFV